MSSIRWRLRRIFAGALNERFARRHSARRHLWEKQIMIFDWDEDKAKLNESKHGVSFDEAVTVFEDHFFVDFYDPKHSIEEHRFLIIGQSNQGRLLIVSYTDRNDKIRIISARELTGQERRTYEHGKFE